MTPGSSSAATVPRSVDSFVVASFNLHWGVDRDARPFDVLGACLALDPDVLVLQEAWRPARGRAVVDDLAAALGAVPHELPLASDTNPARPRGLRPPAGAPGTCGLAVLSRLPVLARTDVDLGHAPGDVIRRRHGLCVTIRPPGGSPDAAPVTVAAVHASHRLWGSLPQLRRLDAALKTIAAGPSVIAGDCNMWGTVIAPVLRHRRRAVRGATWPAGRPHSQIDHIWISDGFEVLDGGVGPATGSDHRPVWARLRVRAGAGTAGGTRRIGIPEPGRGPAVPAFSEPS